MHTQLKCVYKCETLLHFTLCLFTVVLCFLKIIAIEFSMNKVNYYLTKLRQNLFTCQYRPSLFSSGGVPLSWAQNLLMATREVRHFVGDEPVCSEVIHLTAEAGKTLVDVVTCCHDDELDAISLDTPPSSSSPHLQQQQQLLLGNQSISDFNCTEAAQLSGVNAGCDNTSAPNFCPELFLNTSCDENTTSSSSSSFAAALPFSLTSSCTAL